MLFLTFIYLRYKSASIMPTILPLLIKDKSDMPQTAPNFSYKSIHPFGLITISPFISFILRLSQYVIDTLSSENKEKVCG